MTVSDKPWGEFSQADYSPAQWQRACLIDTGEGSPESKDRYKLPVLEPSGVLNRNGVHAAAARIGQVEGVSADLKAAGARKLSRYYHEMGEQVPDSVDRLASSAGDGGRSAPDRELRYISTFIKGGSELEVRSAKGSSSRTIGGYAAVFNRNSEDLGGFRERIIPTFFNKSRADGWPGVVCRFNHQDNFLLGTTRSGTLNLSIDNVGLVYDVDLPECRGDVLEMTQRRDLAHSSFAFQCYDEEWLPGDGGYPMRHLVSGRLIDVAPVTVPAYPDATVGLRSLARFVGAPLEDVVAKAACNELRSFFVRTDNAGKPQPQKAPKSGPAALMEILAKRPDDPIGTAP